MTARASRSSASARLPPRRSTLWCGVPRQRAQLELAGPARAREQLGEQDAVVGRPGLLAEHDDLPVLGRAAAQRLLDDGEAGHPGADDDEPLRRGGRAPPDRVDALAHPLQPDGDGLQLGLLGGRVDGAERQRVQRARAGDGVHRAPVERRERDAARHALVERDRHAQLAAARDDAHWSPSPRPAAAASSGWQAIVASPAEARSVGEWPVRVIVCHWSATRPVVSSSGKLGVGRLGGRGVRRRREARAAVGRREAAVLVQAHGALVLADGLRGQRPLHAALAAQALVRDAGHVARPAGGAGGELVEDLGAVAPRERVAVAEVARQPGDDLPVRLGLARRRHGAPDEADPALGARHRALLLRPGGGGQDGVGERGRLGRVVRVLDDDELGALERGARALAVGQRDERVGGHDPDGLHPAVSSASNSSTAGSPGVRRDRARRHVPVLLHRGPVGGVGDLAVAGQQLREAAGLAPAHRVGLAGQRQRPAAGAADLPAGQAEVDERRGSSACRPSTGWRPSTTAPSRRRRSRSGGRPAR